MKKLMTVALMVVFLLASVTVFIGHAQAAGEDNVIDKVGDWFATRGKSDSEAQMIIAQRKMKRATERMQKDMNKGAAQMNKDMKNVFGK